MSKLLAIPLMVFAVSATVAHAQLPYREPARVVISKTAGADCYDPPNPPPRIEPRRSEIVRSPVLASPEGVFFAYSENEAIAFGKTANGPPPDYECENTARIYLAGPKSHYFLRAIVQNATQGSLYNYLGLVDWSPDGRYLLCELFIATYGTDSADQYVLLYDARYDVLSPRDLFYHALDRYFRKRCGVVFAPLGFSADGKIAIRIGPAYDVEGPIEPDSCTKQDGIWLLDASKGTLAQAPSDFKLVHYGRWLSAPGTGKHASR